MHEGRRIEVWCSNDYLDMSRHPDVIRAQVDSTIEHGVGSGGSRNIAGTSQAHVELEESLAAWYGKERALLFSTGYTANFETLSTLLSVAPDMVVYSDELNHRSLIEGVRRSATRKHIFPHNDIAALEKLLGESEPEAQKLIVFESVYSMEGDHSPISEICDLADRYGALTYLDETHAIGMTGPTGAGRCEQLGEDRITFIQGVFSKALGTFGGFVAGPDSVLDFVRSKAPGFIFTTTAPRPVLDASQRSLELVRGESGRQLRETVRDKVRLMKRELTDRDVDFIDAPSHLVPVLVSGGRRVKRVSRMLLEEFDIYVQPINFPSVPLGAERFRVTVAPSRTAEQIARFAAALRKCLNNHPTAPALEA
jgi:5-aminolevulinate synthase